MWNSNPHTHRKKEFWNIIWLLYILYIWFTSDLSVCSFFLTHFLALLLPSQIKSTPENTMLLSLQKVLWCWMLTKRCGNLCLLCLPEKYIDVPQDGRGKIRLHGAAFKETIQWQELKKWWIEAEREKGPDGGWPSHLERNIFQTTSIGKQCRKNFQKTVLRKQYFNFRPTILSLKGNIMSEKVLSRKKIKLLWQIWTKVEKDHKTNLWYITFLCLPIHLLPFEPNLNVGIRNVSFSKVLWWLLRRNRVDAGRPHVVMHNKVCEAFNTNQTAG